MGIQRPGPRDQLIAFNDSGSNAQETKYYYADLQSIADYDANLLTHATYPDSSSTPTSGSDLVKMEYNLDGSLKKRTDQRGVVMEYTFNTRRQVELEKATTIPSGVYGGASETDAVRMIGRTYDDLGRPTFVTSYKSTTVQSSDILNEVKLTYGTHGLVTQSDQDHYDAVGSGTSHQSVQYAFDETTASMTNIYDDGLRQETVTYPEGRVIFNDFGTADAISDRLARIYRIRETNSSGTILTEYSYNGVDRHIITDYPQPDFRLDQYLFWTYTGVYWALDRFGRPVDHMWDGYNSTFDVARYRYGYDYVGNRTWREDVKAGDNGYHYDEFYTYDGLHRLTDAPRGNLTGTHPNYTGITSKNFQQVWTLDQLGNWTEFKQDTDGNSSYTGSTDLDQDRSHNAVNELSTISNAMGQTDWPDASHDEAGNMTTLPQVRVPTSSWTAKYDAWNRLVEYVQGVWTFKSEYDGLGRRIVWTFSIPASSINVYQHFYYNEHWQVIEERYHPHGGSEDSDPQAQFVWHPYYIDALAVRDYDEDTDNNLAEGNDGTHYYAHDAIYSVTAITNSSGTVLERYLYSAYGKSTVLDASFAADADDVTDIGNHYRFTGREVERVTNLQLNRYRFHQQQLGRWVTRDPIEYDGGMNLYAYVGGMPTQFADAFGLWEDWGEGPSPRWPQPPGDKKSPPQSPDGKTDCESPVTAGTPKPSPKFKTPTNPPQEPIAPERVPPGWRVRVMPPTEQYPNGYWRLEKPMPNGGWQGIDPSTMKPGPQPTTHVPLPPRGPAPIPQVPTVPWWQRIPFIIVPWPLIEPFLPPDPLNPRYA